MAIALGYISLTTHPPEGKDAQNVYCLLGPTPPKVTGGYGGWEKIERPKKKAVTQWKGSEPLEITVTLLLDNFRNRDGLTTEHAIKVLERMAGHDGRDGDTVPPPVTWRANDPHDADNDLYKKDLWIVTSLEWDDNALRNESGNVTRIGATIVLTQFVDDEVLVTGPKKNKSKKDKGRLVFGGWNTNLYTVKKGDTLSSIARDKLGRAGRWPEIRRLNPTIRDPDNLKKFVGKQIILPYR